MRQARRCVSGVLRRLPRAGEGRTRARGTGLALAALLGGAACSSVAAQSEDGLIPGISSYADAVVGNANRKWVGQRVPAPAPAPPPASGGWLDSSEWPLRVHGSRTLDARELALLRQVLRAAEATVALGSATSLFALPRPLDLYLVDAPEPGAAADAASIWSGLDSVHSFALVDRRAPRATLAACVAEALVDAVLLALDPAESPSVRRASAAYFAWLTHGDTCAPAPAADSPSFDQQHTLRTPGALALWLAALGATRDQNRGVFLAEMWQFARQRTWEGRDLRGSPDLIEATAKALELGHERLEEIAAALAARVALAQSGIAPLPGADAVRYGALPAHLAPSRPLGPLDASVRVIDLERPRPGERITIWSRGEAGVRWALGATRLRADGSVIAQHAAAVRKIPDAELQLELDGETRFVLVTVVNMAQGVPDPDLEDERWDRSVRLIVDRAK